jgi:hypothetical protein
MPEVINIYCDESCHLENDHQPVMVLGAIWCPLEQSRTFFSDIRGLKEEHRLSSNFEIKWTKVSPAKLDFYRALLDYFFDNDHLHFRALIVPDKTILNHAAFAQDHDSWYYKMYFDMLKVILDPDMCYRIYLDIKDTRGGDKVRLLREVLSNNMYDFSRQIIEWIQLVRSEEVELLQLADLLIGIISYANRELHGSAAKTSLVAYMRERSGYELTKSTLLKEDKVNLFCWHAREFEEKV